MVRFSGTDVPTWRRAVTNCTGTAAVTGLAIGACVIAAAAMIHDPAAGALLALGLTLPGLLLQDSWRYSFFALGCGSLAFINDSIWAATLIPALVLLHLSLARYAPARLGRCWPPGPWPSWRRARPPAGS